MTPPGCPMHDNISSSVEWAVMQVDHVASVDLDVVFDPPWTPELMSQEAKQQLGWAD
jgi:metal-sulfur cluster biosynthetic enzyme